MTSLKIQAFGGEVPRQPPRALPDGGAQRYQNLLATATELRPLAGDKVVGSSPAGAQSLHRLPRTSGGALRTDDASGWMADAADKNYVAGQLNDAARGPAANQPATARTD